MIDQTLEIPQKQVQKEETPVCNKSCCKPTSIIPAVLATIILVAGAFYAGIYLGKKQTSIVLPPIPSPDIRSTDIFPTQVPIITPTLDETLNWKIYKNEKYKYQFKYPNDWTLVAPNLSDPRLEADNLTSVRENNDIYPLHEVAVQAALFFVAMKSDALRFGWDNTPTQKEYIINGKKVWNIEGLAKWVDDKTYWRIYSLIQIDSDDNVLKIDWFDTPDQNSRKIFDQILSTFKFQEKTAD
jgi:hypothetical protein